MIDELNLFFNLIYLPKNEYFKVMKNIIKSNYRLYPRYPIIVNAHTVSKMMK